MQFGVSCRATWNKHLGSIRDLEKERLEDYKSINYGENVPDTRESPVVGIIEELKEFGVEIYGYDPLLSKEEIESFAVKALDDLNVKVDCVIVAVAHDEFKEMTLKDFLLAQVFFSKKKKCVDVRGMFDGEEAERREFCYRMV